MASAQDVLSTADRSRLDRARAEFDAEVIYLNSATMGLPPRRSWLALQTALQDWRRGTANPIDYDKVLESARAS
ncbi:MAG: aminotransferase, partial [Actinomycetota bacterium]|nr:aminotransferase [Actinomycetota bacterium]